ncbi:hypothetical protein TNIN_450691 [Trichonephila inaurata madagascariensis]|uniref:Uncharacterized protein n=1 Tax=Trichonephila inaurata madagascariensis TaxID=2747483 RepID=A0A8X6MHM9_9ARAC|nr:hypothetical protein TNIN_450691 [Trichonephila inaurata madagascariensis]
MAATGVDNLVFIDDNMNKFGYQKILQALYTHRSKIGTWEQLCLSTIEHTAKIVKEWLLCRTPNQLHSPPQSPNLNPIRPPLGELMKSSRAASSRQQETLRKAIEHAWGPQNFT